MFFRAAFAAAFIGFMASILNAQDLSGLPDCAVACFEANFNNTACNLTDTPCLCADTTFYTDVQICVLTTCNTTDAQTTLAWSQAECPTS